MFQQKMVRYLLLLCLLTSTPMAWSASQTVDLGGFGADVNFSVGGTAALQASLNQLANGETLTFLEGGTYAITATLTCTSVAARNITIASTASSLVVTSNTTTSILFAIGNVSGTTGAQDVTINGGTNRIKFDSASTANTCFRLNQDTNTGITHGVHLTNVDIENIQTPATVHAGFSIRGSSGAALGGPLNVSAVNSTFKISNAGNVGRCAFGTADGTNVVLNDATITLTNCTLEAGITTTTLNGSAFNISGGNGSVPPASNIDITLNNCTLTNWATTRPTFGHVAGASVRFSDVDVIMNDCTLTNKASFSVINFPLTNNDTFNPGDINFTLNRCTLDNTNTNALNVALRFTMTNSTTTTGFTYALSTLKMYNCLVKTGTAPVAANTQRGVRVEGKIDAVLYHNTIVSLGKLAAASSVGDVGITINNTSVPVPPTWTASDNIVYNFTRPINFSGTVGIVGTQITPSVACSKNLIAGPNDADPTFGTDRIYTGTGVLLGTNELSGTYQPIGAAVDAASSQVAGVPDGVVSAAVGNFDRAGTHRGHLGTWDIGAFESNAVPVEMSIFTID